MAEIIELKRGPIRPQELVLKFMDSVGHKQDAESYLKIFTSQMPESFAIVVIEEDVLREDLDAVVFDLRYLTQLGLYPTVVVSASEKTLDETNIGANFERARLSANFLSSDLSSLEKLDFVRSCIKKKSLAVYPIPTSTDLFDELTKLTTTLKAKKVIFLRRQNGIFDERSQAQISIVNLRFDKERLLALDTIAKTDKDFLEKCDQFIKLCYHKVFIAAVSPINLLRELFTVKGAGTLIQVGSQILNRKSWADVDKQAIRDLLESSFEKPVRANFFGEPMDHIYVEENGLGAALLRDCGDMTYLSKFAVGTEARGLGIGRDIWDVATRHHNKIFWRSDPSRFITRWYVRNCDGMQRTDKWMVFWKGIAPEQIPTAIKYATEQGEDFV